MAIIKTYDWLDGTYMDEAPGGLTGFRMHRDRRYWMACASAGRRSPEDCFSGVMDEFGTLVRVPFPIRPPQQ